MDIGSSSAGRMGSTSPRPHDPGILEKCLWVSKRVSGVKVIISNTDIGCVQYGDSLTQPAGSRGTCSGIRVLFAPELDTELGWALVCSLSPLSSPPTAPSLQGSTLSVCMHTVTALGQLHPHKKEHGTPAAAYRGANIAYYLRNPATSRPNTTTTLSHHDGGLGPSTGQVRPRHTFPCRTPDRKLSLAHSC